MACNKLLVKIIGKVHSWVEHWLEQLLQSLNLTLAVTEWCEGLSQVVPLPQLQSSSAISLIEHVFNSAVYHVEKGKLERIAFFLAVMVDDDDE
jgi:hypothetical protein